MCPVFFRCLVLVTALAFSLASTSNSAHVNALGVIMQAKDARISTSPVSAGSSVYDGDRLSTEANGSLSLRAGAAIFFLAANTRATFRNLSDSKNSAAADLAAGTLVFSIPQNVTIQISADEAQIRPAADAPTLGQITIAGPKTLYLYARRGSLKFAYREETQIIHEGESYRVILDPEADAPDAKPAADPSKRPARHRRRFLLLLLAAAARPGFWKNSESQESPFQP
jgi:hypothetical protein